MRFDVRLRLWSFCQYLYALLAPRFDRHERAIRREMRKDPMVAELGDDDPVSRMVRRLLLKEGVWRGHFDGASIDAAWKDFRTLGDPEALASDEWVIQVARTQILRHIEHGRAYSGYLRGYLRAQLAHLDSCEACQAKACELIRRDVRAATLIRDLSRGADIPPEPDDGEPPSR